MYTDGPKEIMKLLKSFKPNITHDVKFNYSHDIKHSNNKLIKILFKFFQIFKKQQNLLSIYKRCLMKLLKTK